MFIAFFFVWLIDFFFFLSPTDHNGLKQSYGFYSHVPLCSGAIPQGSYLLSPCYRNSFPLCRNQCSKTTDSYLDSHSELDTLFPHIQRSYQPFRMWGAVGEIYHCSPEPLCMLLAWQTVPDGEVPFPSLTHNRHAWHIWCHVCPPLLPKVTPRAATSNSKAL